MSHPVTSKKHLRVRTPKTTDGTQVLIEDGKVQYKTRYLPFTAKSALERENAKLPKNLKHIIEEMPGDSGNSDRSGNSRRAAGGSKPTTGGSKPGDDGGSGNSGNSGGDSGNSGDDEARREELVAMLKTDLQSEFEKKFGEKPANALTKEQLADAIITGEIPE